MATELTAKKKLKYLSVYMGEWIDKYPGKIKPFYSWLDSTIDNKINTGRRKKKEHHNSICHYCRRAFQEYRIDKTRDHIVPLSKGGLDKKENRVPCCFDCNQWKSDRILEEWLKELQLLVRKERTIKPPYTKSMLGLMMGNIKTILGEINSKPKKVSQYKI